MKTQPKSTRPYRSIRKKFEQANEPATRMYVAEHGEEPPRTKGQKLVHRWRAWLEAWSMHWQCCEMNAERAMRHSDEKRTKPARIEAHLGEDLQRSFDALEEELNSFALGAMLEWNPRRLRELADAMDDVTRLKSEKQELGRMADEVGYYLEVCRVFVRGTKPTVKQYKELSRVFGSGAKVTTKTMRKRIRALQLPLAGCGQREDERMHWVISYFGGSKLAALNTHK